MAFSKRDHLEAILKQRCPRCLRGRVFPPGNWLRLRMYYACPACGVVFGRENGYFTGAMIVSYVLAVPLLAVLCLAIAALSGWPAEWVILVGMLYFLPFVPA